MPRGQAEKKEELCQRFRLAPAGAAFSNGFAKISIGQLKSYPIDAPFDKNSMMCWLIASYS